MADQYSRDVMPRPATQPAPVVQSAQSYEAQQVQRLLTAMAQRGEQPIMVHVAAPTHAGRDVDWSQIIKWLTAGVTMIVICALMLVTCAMQPPAPPPPVVHKPSCIALC